MLSESGVCCAYLNLIERLRRLRQYILWKCQYQPRILHGVKTHCLGHVLQVIVEMFLLSKQMPHNDGDDDDNNNNNNNTRFWKLKCVLMLLHYRRAVCIQ
jgi:hypothetical protein